MRALFTAHGAHGHIFPVVAVARALVRLGHDVTVATSRDRCATVAALGLAAVPAGLDDASLVAQTRRRWPETEHDPPSSWAARMFTDIAAAAMAADLNAIVASQRPDVIIREEGEHAGPVVAAAAEIPWVTHGWGSPRPPRDALDSVASAVAPLWQAAGLQVPAGADLDGIAVLDPCPPSLYPPDAPSRANPIRPQAPALDACDRLPAASQRPLAYVGFGTVALYQDRPQLITAAVRAVLARGLDAVVSTPDPVLTARLTALAPDRVHVQRWLSLPAVLARCSLAVCHGGAGTVLAALAAGIPLLLLPQGAPSQVRMSNACARRGVARVIDSQAPDTVTLHEGLEQLTTDARLKTAACEVAAEIRAMPCADAAATAIEALITP